MTPYPVTASLHLSSSNTGQPHVFTLEATWHEDCVSHFQAPHGTQIVWSINDMGRVRKKRKSPAVDCISRFQQQGSSSILDPFSLLVMAAVACVLFVGTAFSQTTAPASGHSSNSAPARKYKLNPDPFNSTLADEQNSAKTPPVTTIAEKPNTSERLAAQPSGKIVELKHEAKALSAKYDISRIGDRGVGKKLNFFSLEKEEALGRELSLQVEQQAKLIQDPLVTEYVNRLGQMLVRHSDAQVPFTIKVIDDEQVNAFALPGGFFYVNSGLILSADNEAELAGVMAHEIAHVAARHATRNATKQEIWNLASLPLIFVGGPVTAAIRQIASFAVPMSFLKFSRDAEREADFLGLEYQYSAGYDPTAFVDFFEKLEAQNKIKSGMMARAFSTHPMNDDRIRRAEAELAMLPSHDDYILDTSEFDQVKAHLEALTRGRNLTPGGAGRPVLRKHATDDAKPPVLKRTGSLERSDATGSRQTPLF